LTEERRDCLQKNFLVLDLTRIRRRGRIQGELISCEMEAMYTITEDLEDTPGWHNGEILACTGILRNCNEIVSLDLNMGTSH